MKRKSKVLSLPERCGQGKTKVLQSFVSCLYYLSQEAAREGLPYITAVLKDTIGKIDLLSRGELIDTSELIDDSLYEALSFLHELSELEPADRADFMAIYNSLRKTIRVREKKVKLCKVEKITLL
jgi:hypothetical protein